MCPACLAASAAIALKAASAGGATALAVKALRSKFTSPSTNPDPASEGDQPHEPPQDRDPR
jgi:hypothetical protein